MHVAGRDAGDAERLREPGEAAVAGAVVAPERPLQLDPEALAAEGGEQPLGMDVAAVAGAAGEADDAIGVTLDVVEIDGGGEGLPPRLRPRTGMSGGGEPAEIPIPHRTLSEEGEVNGTRRTSLNPANLRG